MKKISTFENQNEALRIKTLLESANIPFVIKDFGDAVYSSVFQNQYGWGLLEAPEEYEEEILALIKSSNKAVLTTKVEEEITVGSKWNFYHYSTGFLFVACLILVWLYYDIKRSWDNSQMKSITNSEWSSDGLSLVSRWEKNNQLAFVQNDENIDRNFEKSIGYDTSGNIMSTFLDFNENGMIEKFIYYSEKDKIREDFVDINEDGSSDVTNIYFSAGDYLSFRTDTKSKKYSEVLVKDSTNNTIKKYSMEEFLLLLKN